MILVDTNIWSELVRPVPEPCVVAWEERNAHLLWLSSVVVGEFLSGVELMPDGRAKQTLRATYDEVIRIYEDRIATFELSAALLYAEVLARQERAGRAPGTADTQIAATALAYDMKLATRNTKHFAGLGLVLIDPWDAMTSHFPSPPSGERDGWAKPGQERGSPTEAPPRQPRTR